MFFQFILLSVYGVSSITCRILNINFVDICDCSEMHHCLVNVYQQYLEVASSTFKRQMSAKSDMLTDKHFHNI